MTDLGRIALITKWDFSHRAFRWTLSSQQNLWKNTFSRILCYNNKHISVIRFFLFSILNWTLLWDQGRTGHSGNASLDAVAFSISHTKCQKGAFCRNLDRMSQELFDTSPPLPWIHQQLKVKRSFIILSYELKKNIILFYKCYLNKIEICVHFVWWKYNSKKTKLQPLID
jgi:hypothetical protein